MPRMSKDAYAKLVRAEIDRLFNEATQRVKQLEPLAGNPRVAQMVERNKGYITALEDITEFMLRNGK